MQDTFALLSTAFACSGRLNPMHSTKAYLRRSVSKSLRVFLVCGVSLGSICVSAATRDGETVYRNECASCHETVAPRMPSKTTLAERSPQAIVKALETGTMRVVGTFNLNGPERVAVAEYLTGKSYSADWSPDPARHCNDRTWSAEQQRSGPQWHGWGNGPANQRFQSAADAGLDKRSVPKLELAWAFAFPGETIAESQPTLSGGRLFVGSRSGRVYALDAQSGCVYWTFDAGAPVKSSVLIAPYRGTDGERLGAYFSDLGGTSYGVDAASGNELWQVRVESHPAARIMGSMQLADGQLLVPMTSTESYLAADPEFECCEFRGSVTSLDPATGQQNWKYFAVPEAEVTGVNPDGVKTLGPAGATIWSAPTWDAGRRLAYVGTGENYSNPPTETSDAILAISTDTGRLVWSFQGLAGDAWNMSCNTDNPVNCPSDSGPDFDFGSSPILARLKSGKEILIGAQKSGVVHALDPDDGGRLLWQRQIAKGGILGGIEWGPAVDDQRLYVAIADIDWENPDLMDPDITLDRNVGGGLVALDLASGEVLWEAPGIECGDRPQCSPAQTAAVTVVPGVVFSGSMSGDLRAFDVDSGEVLWSFNTARQFETVNGASGRGGALDATGPIVAGGWVYTVSGYSKWGGLPGNVLLAFRSGTP